MSDRRDPREHSAPPCPGHSQTPHVALAFPTYASTKMTRNKLRCSSLSPDMQYDYSNIQKNTNMLTRRQFTSDLSGSPEYRKHHMPSQSNVFFQKSPTILRRQSKNIPQTVYRSPFHRNAVDSYVNSRIAHPIDFTFLDNILKIRYCSGHQLHQ